MISIESPMTDRPARFNVFVTDDRYGSYVEETNVLAEVGARLEVLNLRSEEEAIKALRYADGILVNMFQMTKGVIDSLERCRVISRYGVGFDNVDIDAATRKKIQVARVPDYSIEDVSDQALALLLACVRNVAFKDRKVREGSWNLQKLQATNRIAGRTLGLIGFGSIARCLRRKVEGFGLGEILVYDPFVSKEDIEKSGAVQATLDTLLVESDYVSVHAPLSAATKGLLNRDRIALMKKKAILVNTSRGAIIEEAALAAALKEGRIGSAGLDVFEIEPLPVDSELKRLDNVVLADHTGWYSEESVLELKTKAAQNIAQTLLGDAPRYPVNTIQREER